MGRFIGGVLAVGLCFPIVGFPIVARGQDQPDNRPVSREEFNELKKDDAELKKELAGFKKQQEEQASSADQDAQDNDKRMKAMQDDIDKARPGLENLVIVGDASFGFMAQRHNHSTFFADVSPLILWQPPDSHFLIETAFDLGIGASGDQSTETTTITVNLADISYEVCDYCMIGAGLFSVPFGQYHNHFDPPWINKFPDAPLVFGDSAIGPTAEVGFFVRGAIPSGTTRWTYDIYVANGPNLITDDPNAAGQLNFDDFTDLNNNKAVGGRLGFLPCPDIEMGYSVEAARVNPSGFPTVNATLQALDCSYRPVIDALDGQLDVRGEWIWSHVGAATYDPAGTLGFGPVTFGNNRSGGYVQVCYRATKCDNSVLRNIEFCTRYDTAMKPLNSPGGDNEQRWTLGVDYWFTSYIVAKTAYEIDQKKLGPDQDAFFFQVDVGL